MTATTTKHHSNVSQPPQQQNSQEKNTEPSSKQLDLLFELSRLLDTKLDKQTLKQCLSMIESGANPAALAQVVMELKRSG